MEDGALTEQIIGCAMKVHRTLGPGFLESVCSKALAHELRKAGIEVECHSAVRVMYDTAVVGNFIADMLIAGTVIVEIKAIRVLAQIHELQLVNYLTATGIEIGLLLNFAAASLQVRRKHRTYREPGFTGE